MENHYSVKKVFLDLTHLPTWMLIIGYPVYWLELYVLKAQNGVTSPMASFLFISVAIYAFIARRRDIASHIQNLKSGISSLGAAGRVFILAGGVICLGILLTALYAALLPPHLTQEYDALNYHLTIPRQHLILHSFARIPWAAADLFPLPIDFALSPYWFVTTLPNKLPQFLFLLGLLGITGKLTKQFSNNNVMAVFVALFAVLGSHNVGIQMGTAMLDIVLCYLFLAAIDSFLSRRYWLGAVEFAFFFWAKSFIPYQITLIILGILLCFLVLNRGGFKGMQWGFDGVERGMKKREYTKVFFYFLAISFCIAGPFVAKSLYYAGTPSFPFGVGMLKTNAIAQDSVAWKSLASSADILLQAKDDYGYGRSPVDFVKHLWLVAVPDKGVNNRFDYPLGLPYLLFVGPFVYLFALSLRKKEFVWTGFFIILYWLSWWFGSQQTRFLYIPLALMFIVVSAALKNPSKILITSLIIALLFNGLSVIRAHRHDFGQTAAHVLRKKDLIDMETNNRYLAAQQAGYVYLDDPDAPFAQFPVMAAKEKMPYILAY